MFEATINVPGYLPVDDERHLFDTPQQAWEFLLDVRQEEEDAAMCFGSDHDPDCPGRSCPWHEEAPYSSAYQELITLAESDSTVKGALVGIVYGATPGSHSRHDLGLAYTVTEVTQ